MTEEEAKTKWCPFASNRVVQQPKPDGNTWVAHFGEDKAVSTHCIATACMAWRVGNPDRDGLPAGHPGIITGFCGLSGASQ